MEPHEIIARASGGLILCFITYALPAAWKAYKAKTNSNDDL